MKKITYRDLQTNAKWMKELPVALTRYGKIVAIIHPHAETAPAKHTCGVACKCKQCGAYQIAHEASKVARYGTGICDNFACKELSQ